MRESFKELAQAFCVVGLAAISAYLYLHGAEGAASGWALGAVFVLLFGRSSSSDDS